MRKTQNGQAAVLLAVTMAALVAFTALCFMAGSSYISRRNMQQVADGFTLSFGSQISGLTCATSPILTTANVKAYADYADGVLSPQIQSASSSSISGNCTNGWTLVYSHPNSLTINVTYPYNHDYRDVLALVNIITPLQLSKFLGVSSADLFARSVARHAGGGIATGYAIMAHTSLTCHGSVITIVQGSIYSSQLPTTKGGCGFQATAVKDSYGSYSDYGNFTVYADGNPWGSSLLADGYEEAGHVTPTCGVTPTTQYVNGNENGENPSPCSLSYIPPVTSNGWPLFPEPNVSFPQPSTGKCVAATNYGSGPAPTISGGVTTYAPGCYSSLDLSSASNPVFSPGFYYFNGVGSGVNGLSLGKGTRLLGSDVSLEFVNTASISTGGKCSVGQPCGFGADPAHPVTLGGKTYGSFSAPPSSGSAWCSSVCPLAGMLIWSSSTGSFNLEGPGESSWFSGSIYWPSDCTWDANGTSSLLGQIVCNTIDLQGGSGSSGTSVTYSDLTTSTGRGETTLIE